MSETNDDVNVIFGAQIAGLLSGLGEATAGVKESVEGMKGQLESLAAVGESVMAPFIAIGGLLAGGELFKETIADTTNMAVQLEVMQQKTGMSAEQLSALSYAATQSHISSDILSTSLDHLARSLQAALISKVSPAALALQDLGVKGVDATGKLRPMGDLLPELVEQFSRMPDGTQKTADAMALFGRSGGQMIPFLNQGRAGLADLEAEAKRLGITMDGSAVDSAVAYKDTMERLDGVVDGLKRQLVVAMLPALTSVAQALTGASDAGDGFHATGVFLGDTIRAVASGAAILVAWLEELVGAFEAVNDAGKLHFSAAKADLIAMKTIAVETVAQLKTMWADVPTVPPKKTDTGNQGGAGGKPIAPSVFSETDADAMIMAPFEKQQKAADAANAARLKSAEELQKDLAASEGKGEATVEQGLDRQAKANTAMLAKLGADQARAQAQIAAGWENLFSGLTRSLNTAVLGMIRGTESLEGALVSAFRSITGGFITSEEQQLEHHIATELAKKNVTAASLAERVALESWAAIKTVALNAWAAITSIANYAATGIAAAWAAISAIPVVGPFLAPVVAVAAGAGILALAGSVRSAEGGYDIPAGLNPMTQLHAQEMVLPAKYANLIRGLAGDDAGAAGSGGTHFHFAAGAIVATDAKSFEGRLQDSAVAVAKAVIAGHKAGVRLPTAPGRGA